MKLTKQQIEEIRKLRSEGKKICEIAKLFNVNESAIQYWVNEKHRERVLSNSSKRFKEMDKEGRRKIYENAKEYQRKYQNNRYHTDEVFRRKMIEANKRKKE